jgi:sugar phosphate isomerase/epimerase
MKFAVFTASLPEWTPQEAVAQLADAGYDGVEWRVTDQTEGDGGKPGFWAGNRCTWPLSTLLHNVDDIRRCTQDAGLAMPALGTYAACDEPEAVEIAMRAAKKLGVGQLRVRVPNYDPAGSYADVWRRRRDEYSEIAALAARNQVRALVEIHHETPVQSPHAAAAFVDGFDPAHVGVIHDVGNMVFEGWAQYRLGLEVLGKHLAHVHVKNGQWLRHGTRPDGSTEWRTAPAALRDGIADVPALFRALRQVGYEGWVTLEDFSEQQPLHERIRDNLAVVRAATERAAASEVRPSGQAHTRSEP